MTTLLLLMIERDGLLGGECFQSSITVCVSLVVLLAGAGAGETC